MSTNGKAASMKNLRPAKPGDRVAETHGAFVQQFTLSEQAEIAELEDRVRELVPVDSPTIEPAISVLSLQLWRYGRLVEYVADKGMHVGRSDRERLRPAALHMLDLERAILTSLKTLGMTPASAADLGLQLVRLERKRIDLSRLSEGELAEFTRLAQKATPANETWSDDAA